MTSAQTQNDPLFSLEEVYFSIEGKEILKDINVDLTTDNITGIIGPSGSGKSTFLRLLNCLITPTSGTIKFENQCISEIEITHLRKHIGMVQQRPFLFEGTVKSNLLYGPSIWDISYTDDELLNFLDIVALDKDFLDRPIEGLSGGEQQRVSIARSLANKPNALLLDEPTSSLDVVSEEIIESTLKRLAADGMKIIIVTHSLEQTKRLTDQLLFLRDGTLIEKTTTKDFFSKYSDTEIRTFFKERGES